MSTCQYMCGFCAKFYHKLIKLIMPLPMPIDDKENQKTNDHELTTPLTKIRTSAIGHPANESKVFKQEKKFAPQIQHGDSISGSTLSVKKQATTKTKLNKESNNRGNDNKGNYEMPTGFFTDSNSHDVVEPTPAEKNKTEKNFKLKEVETTKAKKESKNEEKDLSKLVEDTFGNAMYNMATALCTSNDEEVVRKNFTTRTSATGVEKRIRLTTQYNKLLETSKPLKIKLVEQVGVSQAERDQYIAEAVSGSKNTVIHLTEQIRLALLTDPDHKALSKQFKEEHPEILPATFLYVNKYRIERTVAYKGVYDGKRHVLKFSSSKRKNLLRIAVKFVNAFASDLIEAIEKSLIYSENRKFLIPNYFYKAFTDCVTKNTSPGDEIRTTLGNERHMHYKFFFSAINQFVNNGILVEVTPLTLYVIPYELIVDGNTMYYLLAESDEISPRLRN